MNSPNELALQIARQRLADLADTGEQCRKAGAIPAADRKSCTLDYFERTCRITLPAGDVSFTFGDPAVPAKDTILVLDYLTRASGEPLTGTKITYKELHDGINYYGVFSTRTIRPLVKYFGNRPEQLLLTGQRLGGVPAAFGDAAVTLTAFPRVPLTYVLWKGDDEFPPEGSILFDSTVSGYLTNDDIHALCETVIWRLVRLAASNTS